MSRSSRSAVTRILIAPVAVSSFVLTPSNASSTSLSENRWLLRLLDSLRPNPDFHAGGRSRLVLRIRWRDAAEFLSRRLADESLESRRSGARWILQSDLRSLSPHDRFLRAQKIRS